MGLATGLQRGQVHWGSSSLVRDGCGHLPGTAPGVQRRVVLFSRLLPGLQGSRLLAKVWRQGLSILLMLGRRGGLSTGDLDLDARFRLQMPPHWHPTLVNPPLATNWDSAP